MERKLTFFTSDFHIGHANVIKFDNRPFKDVAHMAEGLISRFNATVPPGSITYFLGDMGMGKGEDLQKVIERLNGKKICLLGNHDKGVESMYKAGFDVVLYGATLYISNERVTLSHCPLQGVWREDCSEYPTSTNWHGDYKQHKFTVKDEGQYHLHGHIHSNPSRLLKSTKILNRQWDVGVVANNYCPVSISSIESWIAKSKDNKNG